MQFVAVPNAHAQPVQPPPDALWHEIVAPQIAPIIERAVKAERDGDMAAAIEAWQEANARGECVAVGVELGLALLRAGRTVEGARQLRYAVLFSPLPHSPRPSEDINERLAEAKEKVGTLLVRTTVDRASLEIDGVHRWEYPGLAEIYVEPEKPHKIVARRENYWTNVSTVTVGAGELKELVIAMEPQVVHKVVNLPTRVMANVGNQPVQEKESRTLLYVSAVGVGVSLAAGITGIYLVATTDKKSDPTSYAAGSGLLIGGGIGLGLSITGFMIYSATRPQPQPVVTISPALSKNQVGLGLSGTW
ncbi:hypothetical protein [Polyangium aurulentum]|uniref:hypothetical protein n=1 Tax=Polyangium aurulentum TaxID=2567896 RepID=UPI0010ADBE0F|nr:hypothetical protein [Polyangium aurulentum]UQA63443.1 hypothetical protein E8A73_024405 [Polyangium aurulentum]